MAESRLFFALWPDRKVRDQLAWLGRQFKPDGGRQHHADDQHITLVFLGQVEDDQLSCIHRIADKVIVPVFSLRLDHLGYWPRPRILWCGPSDRPEALQQLVSDLQQGLQSCGFAPEKRHYQPHVTLHRKVRRAKAGTIENPILWQADEFVLAASGGGAPGQPRYRILHRWALNP